MNNIPIVWITENIKHEFAFRIFARQFLFLACPYMTGASSRYKDAF